MWQERHNVGGRCEKISVDGGWRRLMEEKWVELEWREDESGGRRGSVCKEHANAAKHYDVISTVLLRIFEIDICYWCHVSLMLQTRSLILLAVDTIRFRWLAVLVCHLVHCFGRDWNITTAIRLPWDFIQTFMIHTGWILLALTTPWLCEISQHLLDGLTQHFIETWVPMTCSIAHLWFWLGFEWCTNRLRCCTSFL